jgi:uncharacterized protein YggE
LTPTPQALARALAKAADRAQRLADAYGAKVPVESEPLPRPRSRSQRKT